MRPQVITPAVGAAGVSVPTLAAVPLFAGADREALEALAADAQPMRARKFFQLRLTGHAAVIIDDFANHAHRRQAGQPAEIDGRFRMTGAVEYAATARNQREQVPGTDKIM
jgi:hypothetical protein